MDCSHARSGRRNADWIRPALGALALILALGSPAHSEESEADRAKRLEAMTLEQKNELLDKKLRFDKMEEAEREKLRELHVSIESAPNSGQLHATLSRYHAWLNTLSSAQRSELLTLPADERIERIKELLKQQEIQRFHDFVGNLLEDDRKAIYAWLSDFVTRHEEEILERVDEDTRRGINGIKDREQKNRMLGFIMATRRQDPKMPLPTREDLNNLIAGLTDETQRLIEQAPADQQPERIRELVRATIFSRRLPPVSEEELRKFYTNLPVDQRERLEGLEADEVKRRLTWMYHQEKNASRGGGPGFRGPWQGGGFGPPGPGRPGEGPRGDGRPGDSREGGRRAPSDNREGPPSGKPPNCPPPETDP